MTVWSRGDIDLGQVWQAPDGRVLRVLAIADHPTVEMRNLETGQVTSYVISSPQFADFALLRPRGPGDKP